MKVRVAAALLTGVALAGCSDSPTRPQATGPDPDGGQWATWVLESGAALRPAAPPAAASVAARTEIDEILRLQATLSAAELEEIQRWAGQPTSPWTMEAVHLLERYWILLPDVRTASPANSARIMALLHVAMYDALVAAWDAKQAYARPAPHEADGRVRRLLPASGSPSYPSEHAAAAAAAAEILKYAFPIEPAAHFDERARQAGEVRMAAGLAHRSDVEAGWELGRAVAARVLERARADGSQQAEGGELPESEYRWRPTRPRFVAQPFDPAAGRWRTWVIPSGDAFRSPPPPLPGSPVWERDLDELRRMPGRRTQTESNAARYWATDAPSAWWELFVEEEITSRRMSALHAARAHALVSVAMYDAFVACWDGKFHYGLMRPVTADPEVQTVFSTPPFPSYPSGHSTVSSAAAEVFAHLFPDRASYYRARAHEASLSRVWGGVHYRFDIEAGETLGERVGRAVVARARADGAEP